VAAVVGRSRGRLLFSLAHHLHGVSAATFCVFPFCCMPPPDGPSQALMACGVAFLSPKTKRVAVSKVLKQRKIVNCQLPESCHRRRHYAAFKQCSTPASWFNAESERLFVFAKKGQTKQHHASPLVLPLPQIKCVISLEFSL
jgi:hypothetical protein